MARGTWLWLLLAAASCGGSDTRPDAGNPDAGADGGPDVTTPAPPEPPARPALPPCPAGWREVPDAERPEIVACDPFPRGGPAECDEDAAFFPGGGACERLGPACPAGDFADDVPAGAIFVRAGAPGGGDGTSGSPFGTIAEAIAVAADGGTIVLSRGTFDEVVLVDRPVEIVGACVGGTSIAPSAAGTAAAVTFTVAAALRRVRIGGVRGGVDALGTADPATIEAVAVVSTARVGVRATTSGDLVLRRVAIRDPEGRGIEVAGRGSVRLERVSVRGARGRGIQASGSSAVVTASDVVVQSTRSLAFGAEGFGIFVDHGAAATLDRVAVLANRGAGLSVQEAGASMVATDLVVADTETDDAGGGGQGVQVVGAEGVHVEIDRAAIDRNRVDGIVVFGGGAILEAADVVVRDTRSDAGGLLGRGIVVASGGQMTLDRAAILRSRTEGASVEGAGSTLRANDVLVADTLAQEATGDFGYGIGAGLGTHVGIARVAIESCTAAGLLAYGAGTSIDGGDLSISDVLAGGDGAALAVGLGLDAHDGAAVSLERVAIRGALLAGAAFADPGTTASLVDLDVSGTAARACASCPPGAGGGSALLVVEGAAVEATRFRLGESALCGIHLVGGEADLHEGEIAQNAIGANVQTPGFDVARLNDRVVYRDNGTNLDTSELPVPEGIDDLSR